MCFLWLHIIYDCQVFDEFSTWADMFSLVLVQVVRTLTRDVWPGMA
jgi:hypothetical protein